MRRTLAAASLLALIAGTFPFVPTAGAFAMSLGIAVDLPVEFGRAAESAPVDSIDMQDQDGALGSRGTEVDSKDRSVSQRVERILRDGAIVASAIVRAAVATVCTVVCVGEATVDVIQQLFAVAGTGLLA